ncbi:MAG: EAL domain-containing protein [Dokdonella sp.]|uniref:EAL domain-containing protein n=1 Tax=Dokdonella sp. TaxID=2291710 RepID=UPI003266772F
MSAQQIDAQDPGREQLLMLQLPQRLARLCLRGARLGLSGWDINALTLLADDAAMIANATRANGPTDLAAQLDALRETVASLLEPARLPDQSTTVRIEKLIDALALHQQQGSDEHPDVSENSHVAMDTATHERGFPLLETPPENHWSLFSAALTPAIESPTQVASAMSPASGFAPIPSSATRPPTSAFREAELAGLATVVPLTAGAGRTAEQVMQRLSDCLAMDDARIRAGGLLVLVLQDADALRQKTGAQAWPELTGAIGDFLVGHVGRNDLVADAGDGMFLLFNPDCDPGLLEPYALNLRDRVARESFGAGERVVFDIGVCPFVAGALHVDAMRDAAIGAIDAQLAAGRHGVSVVRKVEVAVEIGLLERIRFALETTGFQLLFQPIVSLRGEDDAQFQVLLRMQGDDQRVHTAAEVIPEAKRAGLIRAIDRWVLSHCVELLVKRTKAQRLPRLFISQSLDSLCDPDHALWLRDLLAEHGIPGDAISVELHADDAARAVDEVRRHVLALKEFGTTFTVSGFESGVAGESLLQSLPVDYVKVSPRYLRLTDAAVAAELKTLVEHLQDIGKRVIAPRVEDARSTASLWVAGVDFIQGNFVQQPGADLAFDFQAGVL